MVGSRFHFILLALFICASSSVQAQSSSKVLRNVKNDKSWTVNFSEAAEKLQISAVKHQFVAPEVRTTAANVKAELDARRSRKKQYKNKTYTTSSSDINPQIDKSFNGKPLGTAGVPNDNTMAISNDGIIISAINTTVTILDSDGQRLKFTTLAALTAGQLGFLDRYYDPKVLYDPIADKFILVFLEGSDSDDSRIIVGFSQTKDPTGNWNFYQINGTPLGGTTWSDYPIIAHNRDDLYITVNLLNDGESWQEGFIQSFIWQIDKTDGYQGGSLTQNLFYDIKFNDKSLWSICPVQPAQDFNQTDMYFLSVRPGDASNDTLFLHYIDNTAKSGEATHSFQVIKSDLNYGVPPTAFQPEIGFRLATNDARVLSATLFDGDIHCVQSSLVPEYLSSGIYHTLISDVKGNINVHSELISSVDLDYAYPSISYTGLGNADLNSMLITFSHVGESDYAGTSVVFHNGVGNLRGMFSDVIQVKKGDDLINTFVADTAERWGDYTDIQRKYNEPGVVWLCGSYGDSNARNNVWIASVNAKHQIDLVKGIITYPNPASTSIRLAVNFEEEDLVDVQLHDMQGKLVKELNQQLVQPIATEFLLNTSGISGGSYILSIKSSSGNILHSQKIVIQSIQ